MTRAVMRLLMGHNISDTQTGLRGIPLEFIPELLHSKANKYDFELDMLLICRQISSMSSSKSYLLALECSSSGMNSRGMPRSPVCVSEMLCPISRRITALVIALPNLLLKAHSTSN